MRAGSQNNPETVEETNPGPKAPKGRRSFWRWVVWGFAGTLFLFLAFSGFAYVQGREALGGKPDAERLARNALSPQWHDGRFSNPIPVVERLGRMVGELWNASDHVIPNVPLNFPRVEPARFEDSPQSGLRVTWLGHSTLLLEVDGVRILTDPMWGSRASPLSWMGPKRWYDPLISLEDVPIPDAVVISHDHYDHLDHSTVLAIKDWETTFLVPLGVGAHLERWGVPASRIIEMDWWDRHSVGPVEIVATPARHSSGRHLFDRNRTLWAGYAVVGPRHRVFFSGDTGMFPGLQDIADRLGPFDMTMIEVGAYAQSWADHHMGPEQAVKAHTILQGGVFLPIHWGLFNLSTHGWTEPIERVLVAAEAMNVAVWTPTPGDSYEPGAELRPDSWWPSLPWRPVMEYPVISSGLPEGW